MVFIETDNFKEDVEALLTQDEFAALQALLAEHPHQGDLIVGTGGLRKVRWKMAERGKSGGVRVIYYHVSAAAQIRLLLIYKKGVKDTLTGKEKALLRTLNEGWS